MYHHEVADSYCYKSLTVPPPISNLLTSRYHYINPHK